MLPGLHSTKKTHCQCLYEIENKLPRTKFCFAACNDQWKILNEREKAKSKNDDTLIDIIIKKFTKK